MLSQLGHSQIFNVQRLKIISIVDQGYGMRAVFCFYEVHRFGLLGYVWGVSVRGLPHSEFDGRGSPARRRVQRFTSQNFKNRKGDLPCLEGGVFGAPAAGSSLIPMSTTRCPPEAMQKE